MLIFNDYVNKLFPERSVVMLIPQEDCQEKLNNSVNLFPTGTWYLISILFHFFFHYGSMFQCRIKHLF